MGEKIRTTINIDKDIWELLEIKLPCSRSSFFERMGREYLFRNNNLEELKKQKKEAELTVSSLDFEIKKLEDLQKANNENLSVIEQAMQSVRKIVFNNKGAISNTQIKYIANNNGLSYDILKEKALNENIKISNDNFTETKTHNTYPSSPI